MPMAVRKLCGIFFVALLCAPGSVFAVVGGLADDRRTITYGESQRRYWVHRPRGYDDKKSYPVVLLFHGVSGSPEIAREQTRMNEVADQNQFMVVYPEGVGQSWNAGRCCGQAFKEKVDDVGFIAELLDDLEKTYSVDPSRIYVAGLDNGGMMAYRLGCELSRRLAGIASVGGTMTVDGPRPWRPIPVLEMHAVNDRGVPFRGGRSKRPGFSGCSFRSIHATIGWWVLANYCQKKPFEASHDDHGHFDLELYAPADNEPGAPVVLYKLLEGGPAWPDGVDVVHGWSAGSLIQAVNASQIIWKFFFTHSVPQ